MVVEDVDWTDPSAVPAIHHVANQPIAHHVLEALEAAGVHEVVVASSQRSAEAVRDCLTAREPRGRAALEFVHQPEPMDFANGLDLAAPVVGEAPCIVHAAGGLLAEPLSPLAQCLDGSAPDAILMVHQAPSPDQRLSAAARSLLHLAELDPSRSAFGVAGVWAFGPGGIRSVAGAAASPSGDDLADDAGDAAMDLTVVAQRIAAAGGTIHVRLVDVWRAYRGEAVDLLELNRIVLDQITGDVPQAAREANRIEGRVRIHKHAMVSGSVLAGPVVIGPGATVTDAYIGPYTAIGAGARIEGAEIERSIVSAGASVTHVGTRLTASVIGRNARLFRDFSLPRALRLRIGDGAVVGLS
ncbi:MAG TPA: NDP-sugar synthase [Solirubrobacteraceae bacterium]